MTTIFLSLQFQLLFLKLVSDQDLQFVIISVTKSFFLLQDFCYICFYKKLKMKAPQDLKYTKDHEWIRIDDNIATIGITDFAQGELGDIVYVEIETLTQTLEAETVFGSVEAVKTVSDLFMPLSGEIIELNEALEDNPEIVNEDPYGEGWMVKVRCTDLSQLEGLLDAEAYKSIITAG
jgi:glycine cleavage system H protein